MAASMLTRIGVMEPALSAAKSGTRDGTDVPGIHGACHRARIRATRWFNPGYDSFNTGAVSRIIAIAARPTAVASSMYQAGASALPVT
jgi:hypothetical protein